MLFLKKIMIFLHYFHLFVPLQPQIILNTLLYYLSPEIIIVQLQHQGLLMQSVDEVQSNAGLVNGGAGNGESRTKEQVNVWDEEW